MELSYRTKRKPNCFANAYARSCAANLDHMGIFKNGLVRKKKLLLQKCYIIFKLSKVVFTVVTCF